MTEVYLSLGSNVGNRQKFIEDAVLQLRKQIEDLSASSVYQTEPWGKADQPEFLNICVKGKTELSALKLLDFIKDIEARLGRTHTSKWGPREIDIDILFYGNEIISRPGLEIPHPFLAERAFVLIPLAEIAPDLVHPKSNTTIADLADKLDSKGIKKVDDAEV